MTPDEIRTCLATERAQLHALRLKTRDGYSFWFGAPGKKNRIIRVSRDSGASSTKMKLAVTDRVPNLRGLQQIEFSFSGSTDDLLKYIDREIHLYNLHIAAAD